MALDLIFTNMVHCKKIIERYYYISPLKLKFNELKMFRFQILNIIKIEYTQFVAFPFTIREVARFYWFENHGTSRFKS
jgi:hypothetical protein